MLNQYQHQSVIFRNQMRSSCGALVGIVQGLLADGELNNKEISYLRDWLTHNDAISYCWPGDVIFAQIEQIMADGVISNDERVHLTTTLEQLIGGKLDEIVEASCVTLLPLDKPLAVEFQGMNFCLTGDFVYGPRSVCQDAVERRQGLCYKTITKKIHYLVVGGLGSTEWKHGSYGTKIDKAVQYKRDGLPLLIVHEDIWASSLRG